MKHTCHWPGCTVEVPPKLWGCKPHWFTLPKRLRDKIWATYVPGQEIRKDPSEAYLKVADEVEAWCRERELEKLGITEQDLFESQYQIER